MTNERARVVILGAGVAGAATAYGLARRGVGDVLILERELFPGAHASGRNAALIRRTLQTPTDCRLALEASAWMKRPPADFPADLGWVESGSLTLFDERDVARVERELAMQRSAGLPLERVAAREAASRQPLLDPGAFSGAVWSPGDARIDVAALLRGYLDAAARRGARVRCGVRAEALLVERGRCVGVRVSANANANANANDSTIDIRAEWVVNAAGAWANSLAREHVAPAPLTPCRRTVVVTEPIGADARAPFAWHDGRGFYFREDGGGLLWSPCDEEPSESCDERVDPAWTARARERARALIPSAAGARSLFEWGCLRTLTPDHEMVVGHDPDLPGLFWVAGLGGHGVTHSPRVAELASDLLLDGTSRVVDPALVAPQRGRR